MTPARKKGGTDDCLMCVGCVCARRQVAFSLEALECESVQALDFKVDVFRHIPLLDVTTSVVLERALLVESFATKARERLGSAVCQHVPIQLGFAEESGGALVADMVSACCVLWVNRRPLDPAAVARHRPMHVHRRRWRR
jgi:hypothetical protein